MTKRLTREDFIEKARAVHGDKYNYDRFIYQDCKTKGIIICPKHGEFKQSSNLHVNRRGECPECSRDERRNDLESFVEQAKRIHGDRYDYSKFIYEHGKKPGIIICKEHGEFLQRPNNHISSKSGCPKCCNNTKKTLELFIKESREVHGNKYDYSLFEYHAADIKGKIICPKHGVFLQSPGKHTSDERGCPRCRHSKMERCIAGWLMENHISFTTQKSFIDCKNINPLPFDFYCPDFNCCIEYDGEYHYLPLEHAGGIETQREVDKRDFIKTRYCKSKGIHLIRLDYLMTEPELLAKLNEIWFYKQ